MADKPGILRFTPHFRTVRWGGTRLAEFKHLSNLPSEHIGESWEISGLPGYETPVAEGPYKGHTLEQLLSQFGHEIMGEKLYRKFGRNFPLLIKFIDAADDLSIQVHPADSAEKDIRGKTELWYILKSDPGAYIYSGFNRPIEESSLQQAMKSNQLINILAKHFSMPGDVYYLPAGRIHSIGAGNLLLEIQQASEVTYRLHDYNRLDTDGKPRELHIDKALEAIDYSQTDFGLARPQMLIDCETTIKTTPFFTVKSIQVMKKARLSVSVLESPRIIVAISGSGIVRGSDGSMTTISRGQTLLVPACLEYAEIEATATPLKLITVEL